jgi:hypothetical protein
LERFHGDTREPTKINNHITEKTAQSNPLALTSAHAIIPVLYRNPTAGEKNVRSTEVGTTTPGAEKLGRN